MTKVSKKSAARKSSTQSSSPRREKKLNRVSQAHRPSKNLKIAVRFKTQGKKLVPSLSLKPSSPRRAKNSGFKKRLGCYRPTNK